MRSAKALLVVSVLLAVVCAAHAFMDRYYLRFAPLPLHVAERINDGSWLLPDYQDATLNGSLDLGRDDLTTEAGLRRMLNRIQELSPHDPVNGLPAYAGITFDKWVEEVSTKPFFCTDASQLVILAARQQGLKAREWHLLPPGWPAGQGHSLAEIFNPRTGRWQLVDGQHAAVLRDGDGRILDMLSLLRAYRDARVDEIRIDYGPYQEAMAAGVRGPTTEAYLFKQHLLRTPVLQLREPTWFATVDRQFGLSGHFVIGYPIIVDGWTHDHRIWTTKIAALGTIVFGLTALLALLATLRKRHP